MVGEAAAESDGGGWQLRLEAIVEQQSEHRTDRSAKRWTKEMCDCVIVLVITSKIGVRLGRCCWFTQSKVKLCEVTDCLIVQQRV